MSFESGLNKDTAGAFLTRHYIKDVQQGDGGMVDTLITIVIDYLNNNLGAIKQSDNSNGTTVNIFQYFPQDSFSMPSIVIEATDVKADVNYIGAVYREDPDLTIRTLRGEIELTFDIFARTTREKNSISGWLLNALYRGLFDHKLRKSGIRNIKFIRSVDRGYDQADRVLQFHSHSPSSEIIFRQLVSFRFIFDWVITPLSTVGFNEPSYIKTVSVDGGESLSFSFHQKNLFVPLTFTLP